MTYARCCRPGRFAALVVGMIAVPQLSPATVEFFVAPAGRDTNPGSRAAPFASLEKARDALRVLRHEKGVPDGGATVWLRGGDYPRTNTFELTTEDSGTPASPVSYRAWPGESVRIHGGQALPAAWFAPVARTSPLWARLDPAAREQVRVADLAAHGVSDYGTLRPRGFGKSQVPAAFELFFDHEPLPLAQWPDAGENDGYQDPVPTQDTLTLFGCPVPDVTGRYVADGVQDGVKSYRREEPVAGRIYHLYRRTWSHGGKTHTAWFLAAQASDYPGMGAPWWYVYTPELNRMSPSDESRAGGTVTFQDPARLQYGFAYLQSAPTGTTFVCAGDRLARWTQAEDPWFHGYWQHLWADDFRRAGHIDAARRRITLDGPLSFGIEDGHPFRAVNLLEEITRPGEWYLDRRNGRLAVWPPARFGRRALEASMLESPLVFLHGARAVAFEGITFDLCRSDLVRIEGGEGNAIRRCTLRNAGMAAVRVGGRCNGVEGCTIRGTGEDGVVLAGGDRATLTPAGLYVRDCDIGHFARLSWTYKPGVLLAAGSVGLTVEHNRIHDAPHTAILMEWGNDHTVAFNEISNVCALTSDAGAIYCGRDLASRGNAIRYNFIHHISSPFRGFGVQGIYLDDGISGVEVRGNILYRIDDDGIQHGGGRDTRIVNNVIVACGVGLAADARGTGWMLANGGDRLMWDNLQALPYRGPVWSNAYPACAAIPADWATFTNQAWVAPRGSVFAGNIGFRNTRWTTEQDNAFSYYAAVTNNLADVDPRFVDEARLDLALRRDSPALALPGFADIPFGQIGPRRR